MPDPLPLGAESRHVEREAIHLWFGLTYANYLVVPRTLLQSMPDEWQARFVTCLRELADAFDHVEQAPQYMVKPQRWDGRFMRDPVPHYNRGRTRLDAQSSGEPVSSESFGEATDQVPDPENPCKRTKSQKAV